MSITSSFLAIYTWYMAQSELLCAHWNLSNNEHTTAVLSYFTAMPTGMSIFNWTSTHAFGKSLVCSFPSSPVALVSCCHAESSSLFTDFRFSMLDQRYQFIRVNTVYTFLKTHGWNQRRGKSYVNMECKYVNGIESSLSVVLFIQTIHLCFIFI